MRSSSVRPFCVVLLVIGLTPLLPAEFAAADTTQTNSSDTTPSVQLEASTTPDASDVVVTSEMSSAAPTSDPVAKSDEVSTEPGSSDVTTSTTTDDLADSPESTATDGSITSVPVIEPADPKLNELGKPDTSNEIAKPDAPTVVGPPDTRTEPLVTASATPGPAVGSVSVPASGADPVAWTNTTSETILVESVVDGVATRTFYGAGESISMPGCPVTADNCSVGIFQYGAGGSGPTEPIIFRSYERPPYAIETGNYATETHVSGQGLAPGFVAAENGISYKNITGQPVTVVFDINSPDGAKKFVVPQGKSVDLPQCETEQVGRCKYIVAVGEYDVANPDEAAFTILSMTDIDRFGSSFIDVTGKTGPFVSTQTGITYTNNSGRFEQVIFRDSASGSSSLVHMQPGDKVTFPKCTLMAGNSCSYNAGPPYEEPNATLYIAVTDTPVDGSPTTTPRPPTGTPTLPGGWSWPAEGGPHPRGQTPSNNGWTVPPQQLDLCAQIAGVAKATNNAPLANIGYGCSGVSMGVAAGSGDGRGFSATAIGLGAGAVADWVGKRWGYLPGVAIDVWAYTAGQAVQTDWSSVGSTTRYALKNPGVAVQETIKATGVVLTNIWPAFLPKW